MTNFWLFWSKHLRLTLILIVLVVIGGVFSAISLPKESTPEVNIPVVFVQTALPGASPEDVERLVTERIESQLSGLQDVVDYTSTSRAGVSSIILQFSTSVDADQKQRQVEQAVGRAKPDLPDDATEPLVEKIAFSEMPFLTLALSGPYSATQLEPFAETIESRLETITNVDAVTIVGAPTTEYRVSVSQASLQSYNITIDELVRAIGAANTSLPAGPITSDGRVYNVEVSTRLESLSDLEQVVITTRDASVVTLDQVAIVAALPSTERVVSRFAEVTGVEGVNAQPAVFLDVAKVPGEGSIIALSGEVLSMVEEMQTSNMVPDDVVVTVLRNDADLIAKDLRNLITSGVITVSIIFLILFVFLSFREALLAAVVVPLSYVFTLLIISLAGLTINFLTLFGLLLALGILVDSAIVVTEGIYERMKEGMAVNKAVAKTVQEYSAPLVSGTLTTIFVFLPMFFVSGTIGEFIKSIPWTVIAVLLGALFFSLAIIPALAKFILRPVAELSSKTSLTKWQTVKVRIDKAVALLKDKYTKTTNSLFYSSKRQWQLLIGTAILFVLAIASVALGLTRIEMFPGGAVETFTVGVELPAGSPLSDTSTAAAVVEEIIGSDANISLFSTTIGVGAGDGSGVGGTAGEHFANIRVNLSAEVVDGEEVVSHYEALLPTLPNDNPELQNVTLSVVTLADGPPQGKPVEVRLQSNSLKDVDTAAVAVANWLQAQPGTQNVSDGITRSGGDIEVSVDRNRARLFGLSEQQIALVIRSMISGVNATTITENGEDTSVVVYMEDVLDGRRRALGRGAPAVTLEDLQSTQISTPTGPVPLSAVTTLTRAGGRTVINHRDGERTVTVSADVTGDANAAEIISNMNEEILTTLPASVQAEFGGESADIAESFQSLGMSMMVGIAAIFALLVFQFSSFRLPLMVLTTIPLSLIGVFGGLALTGLPFSFPGFIGVVGLAGIVVNNAIILIDVILQKLRETEIASPTKRVELIQQAAVSRLQPIFLTTITTVAGLTPLVISDPTWAPLAVSIIFGLLFSTLLTLFVVPVLYIKFARL